MGCDMGITVDFIIKHIRPADMDSWNLICGNQGPGSLADWLLNNGVSQIDINHAFNDWAALALLDIHDVGNRGAFVKAAEDVSNARWDELYTTDYSSILFMNAPLLAQLDHDSSIRPNQTFNFDPYEYIPLVVTINRLGVPATVVENVTGMVVSVDANGNCCHFNQIINGGNAMDLLSSEATRRVSVSMNTAEKAFQAAGEHAAMNSMYQFFGITPLLENYSKGIASLTSDLPSKSDINALLNGVGAAPGTSTVVTVPAAPVSGDVALVQNVQTLDSYIATLTALVMYNNHPQPYDLSDKQQAAQFVIDLANARNYVVTGGVVKAIPMYLPMGQATTQSFNKSTTTADLHIDLLTALFGALSLPASVLTELDGILTEIASSLKSLQLSFTNQTQTLNHFVSFYYLTQVPGTNPPINQMNVEFIYIQLAQSAWNASIGKSTVSNFTLNMTTTRTTATMSAGIVAANAGNIVSSLIALTGNDATVISEMTKMKGVKS
jgi:hypothetical protein